MIRVKRETILKNMPNGVPFHVAKGNLKGYAIRKGLIKLPYSVYVKGVEHLWNSNAITLRDYDMFMGFLRVGDYQRVLCNRKFKRLIKII